MPGKTATANASQERTFEFDFAVVGLKFRMDKEKRATLKRSCPYKDITIVREQENQYDANAIAVHFKRVPSWHGKKHIGYIAAESAAIIAPLMDDYTASGRGAKDGLQFKSAVLKSVDGPDNLTATLAVTFIDHRSK